MAHWPKCILTGLHRIWHDIQSDSSRQGHLICALIVLSAPVSRETSLFFPAGPATNIRLVIHQTTFDGTLHLNAKSAFYICIYFLGKTAWKRHRRRRAAMSGRERVWLAPTTWPHTIRAMQTITSQKPPIPDPSQSNSTESKSTAVKLGPNPSPISVHHPPFYLIPDFVGLVPSLQYNFQTGIFFLLGNKQSLIKSW